MCGIAGIYNSSTPEADLQTASEMASAIARRGPDAAGIKQYDRTIFAHRRLAIIDLDHAADQPMCDAQDQCMITFNGEIYNYPELRKQLQDKGYIFRTQSDTEVILALYQTAGADALKQLDGMFALAIYDRRTQELLLMRDRLGKKPLYYFTAGNNTLIFASNLNALKKHPLWQNDIRPEAIHDFLAYTCIPGNESVYENVFKLPPATIMQCKNDGSKNFTQYWHLDYSNKLSLSFEQASEILQQKLSAAVRKRLLADVPCGIFLSGGLDSAIVSALAAQHAGSRLDAFTIGFNESSYDERNLAKATVNWINRTTVHGLEHHTKTVDCQDFQALEFIAGEFGEPFADFSLLPTYFLSKFAASKLKLVLSGDGSDEIFGGYERYIAMRYCARLEKILPVPLRRLLATTANNLFPDYGKRSKLSRLSRFLRLAAAPANQRYALLMTQATDEFRRKLYGEKLQQAALHNTGDFIAQALKNVTSPEPSEQWAECDVHTYLESDILVKADRASMAESLEVRSPFLDKEVVEFAAALPFNFKQQGCCRKRILKHTFAQTIAPEIFADNRKRGFAVPLGQWFRNEWHQPLQEHLLEGKLVSDNWFNRAALESMLQEHDLCRRDHSELLGALLMLNIFLSCQA